MYFAFFEHLYITIVIAFTRPLLKAIDLHDTAVAVLPMDQVAPVNGKTRWVCRFVFARTGLYLKICKALGMREMNPSCKGRVSPEELLVSGKECLLVCVVCHAVFW